MVGWEHVDGSCGFSGLLSLVWVGTISRGSVDRAAGLLWLQDSSCLLLLCSATRFSTAFQNSYDVPHLFFMDRKCKNILCDVVVLSLCQGILWLPRHERSQDCSTLAAAGIWDVAPGACWALCAMQCQAGVAPGFDGVIACPVSEQMLFCFDHPCLGWRLKAYFNCAPVTVPLVYHPCFSGLQKMALGSLLVKVSAKVPKQSHWGRGSAAEQRSTAAVFTLSSRLLLWVSSYRQHLQCFRGDMQENDNAQHTFMRARDLSLFWHTTLFSPRLSRLFLSSPSLVAHHCNNSVAHLCWHIPPPGGVFQRNCHLCCFSSWAQALHFALWSKH